MPVEPEHHVGVVNGQPPWHQSLEMEQLDEGPDVGDRHTEGVRLTADQQLRCGW